MSAHSTSPEQKPTGYAAVPLYLKIIVALVLGCVLGSVLGKSAESLGIVSKVILQLLRLLATPLIFLAVLDSLLKATISGRKAGKLMYLLMSNTVIAILIGITVANVLRPGDHLKLEPLTAPDKKPYVLHEDLLSRVPTDFISPFLNNEIIGVIIMAIALGIAFRRVQLYGSADAQTGLVSLQKVFATVSESVMVLLRGVFELIPIAVFCVVAKTVGDKGFAPLIQMFWFVGAVMLALFLMSLVYMFRLSRGSWVSPKRFLRGASDALVMAFSTASSAATLPLTYKCAKERIGVKEESASFGVMVGGTFNHDGTALYEAMAALFISQAIGQNLSFGEQVMVVIMSVVASVGAAGIPEAGLVTMLAVFTAVKLPTEYIPLLLVVDWFLDRCRTMINVMGDLTSTCILDGRARELETVAT